MDNKELVAKAQTLGSIKSFDINNLTPNQLQLIKNTVAKGASDDELGLFLYMCHKSGLDPLKKEIWFMKRAKKVQKKDGSWDYPRLPTGEIDYTGADVTIMTAKDGFFRKACENPDFSHVQSMDVHVNDDFEMEFDGEKLKVKKHSFKAKDRGDIIGAWACVFYKSGFKDWNYVEFSEYSQKSTYKGITTYTGSWKTNPTAMIKNRAETPILKKAGGLTGIYSEEEMSNVIDQEEVIDNSPAQESLRANEIQSILVKIEKVKDMIEWKAVAEEISIISGGLLQEEKDKIREVAAKKVAALKEAELDRIKAEADQNLVKEMDNFRTQQEQHEEKQYQAKKDEDPQTSLPE